MKPYRSFSRAWTQILDDLVLQYRLVAAVLTDFQGLPFAASLHPEWKAKWQGTPLDQELTDVLAAFAPPLLKTGNQLQRHVGQLHVEEVSLRTQEAFRIVARTISFPKGTPLILTVLVPPHRAYRRAMNHAVRAIRNLGRGEMR